MALRDPAGWLLPQRFVRLLGRHPLVALCQPNTWQWGWRRALGYSERVRLPLTLLRPRSRPRPIAKGRLNSHRVRTIRQEFPEIRRLEVFPFVTHFQSEFHETSFDAQKESLSLQNSPGNRARALCGPKFRDESRPRRFQVRRGEMRLQRVSSRGPLDGLRKPVLHRQRWRNHARCRNDTSSLVRHLAFHGRRNHCCGASRHRLLALARRSASLHRSHAPAPSIAIRLASRANNFSGDPKIKHSPRPASRRGVAADRRVSRFGSGGGRRGRGTRAG